MEITIEELRQMQHDRDALVDQIATLRAKPEAGTFKELADRVVRNSTSFTSDQKDQIRTLILGRGHKPNESA